MIRRSITSVFNAAYRGVSQPGNTWPDYSHISV